MTLFLTTAGNKPNFGWSTGYSDGLLRSQKINKKYVFTYQASVKYTYQAW